MNSRQTKHVRQMIKIRRGGERFWCEVISKDDDGMEVRCDSDTIDPASPRFDEVFRISNDEEILVRDYGHSTLQVIQGGAS